jgi:hypothetical protein
MPTGEHLAGREALPEAFEVGKRPDMLVVTSVDRPVRILQVIV